jgi:hypothetical protein
VERPEEGYYLGALAVNLVAAELVLAAATVGLTLATWPNVPWTGMLIGGAALMILVPAFGYPFAKLIWLAVDLRMQPDMGTGRGGAEPRGG